MKIDSFLFYHWNVIDLLIGLLIFYFWGRSWGNKLHTPKWIALTFLLIGVVASSAFMMGVYGSHYEVTEQHEVWPEGQWENDFEPTDEERDTYGLSVFLYFLIISLIGYSVGRQKAIEKEESYEKMFEKLKTNRLISAEKRVHLNSL